MRLDPETTAVVIVDMQHGFCDPDGSLYAPASADAIDPCRALAQKAREAGAAVILTRDVHPADQFEGNHDYDEFERWGEHVVEGSWDAELVEDLAPETADHIVEKHTYDAFYQTDLEGWLDAHNVRNLVFGGTLANVCVLHTAASAGLRDFRTIIVEDAVGYIEESDRAYALDHADWLFGELTTLDEITYE